MGPPVRRADGLEKKSVGQWATIWSNRKCEETTFGLEINELVKPREVI